VAYNFRDGWVVNPEAPEGSLEAKVPYVDNGTAQIDAERFYAPEWMAREWDRLWTRVWLVAGVVSDVREPGDYFTFDLGRENFLVTRTDSGDIKAFYNVCQHRGNRLVLNEFGSVPSTRWTASSRRSPTKKRSGRKLYASVRICVKSDAKAGPD
jgi:hypothetical protein